MKRVIRDQAAPDQAPQCVDRLARITAARRLMQGIEEAGSARFERRQQLLFPFAERRLLIAADRIGTRANSGSLSVR